MNVVRTAGRYVGTCGESGRKGGGQCREKLRRKWKRADVVTFRKQSVAEERRLTNLAHLLILERAGTISHLRTLTFYECISIHQQPVHPRGSARICWIV